VFQQLPASDDLDPVDRHARLRFFNGREWGVIGLVGGLTTGLVLRGYNYSLGLDQDVLHARSIAMVALIVASATVTAALSGLRSRSALITVAAAVGSAVVVVQFAPLAGLLHMSPLHLTDWLLAALGGSFAGAFALLIPALQRRRGGA
jgi:Ca2+-transporting ATPase